MLGRGTSQRSKAEFSQELASLGAKVRGDTEREKSWTTVSVQKSDLDRAVNLLGDAISNATLEASEVELAKQELAAQHETNYSDYERTTLENVHFNSYRDHMLGQPTYGDRDQVQNLNADILQRYKAANYFGDNIVVVGSGAVNHDQFVDAVSRSFNSVSKTTSAKKANSEKAIYTPSLLMIRDDEMYNSNVGVFYDAPSIKH